MILTNAFNGLMIPRCFTYTKSVRKSIDRYWHRANKIKRKNRWVPVIREAECADGSIIKVKMGKRYQGKI